VGWLYDHGRCVEQDSHEALKWYRKAAKLGDAVAMCNIARYYRDGSAGLSQNRRKALEWLKKAKEANPATVQGDLDNLECGSL
jgi:TPR repeat protein